jgi:multidrug transporter EmrE-like cation transporter
MPALFLALAVAFNVAHNVLLKASASREAWMRLAWVVFALLVGAINALSMSKALERMPLSIAYPTFAGASVALLVVAGALFYGERVSVSTVLGVAAIALGITLVHR